MFYVYVCVCGVAYSYKLQNSVQFFIASFQMSHGEDASLSATSFRSSSYKRVNNLRKAHDDNSFFFCLSLSVYIFEKRVKKRNPKTVCECVCECVQEKCEAAARVEILAADELRGGSWLQQQQQPQSIYKNLWKPQNKCACVSVCV